MLNSLARDHGSIWVDVSLGACWAHLKISSRQHVYILYILEELTQGKAMLLPEYLEFSLSFFLNTFYTPLDYRRRQSELNSIGNFPYCSKYYQRLWYLQFAYRNLPMIGIASSAISNGARSAGTAIRQKAFAATSSAACCAAASAASLAASAASCPS